MESVGAIPTRIPTGVVINDSARVAAVIPPVEGVSVPDGIAIPIATAAVVPTGVAVAASSLKSTTPTATSSNGRTGAKPIAVPQPQRIRPRPSFLDWSPEERNQWLRWDPNNTAPGGGSQPLPAASSPPATMIMPSITGTSAPTLVTLLPSGLPPQPSSPTAAGSSGSSSRRIATSGLSRAAPDTPTPSRTPRGSNPNTVTSSGSGHAIGSMSSLHDRSPLDASVTIKGNNDNNDDDDDDSSEDSRRADRRQKRHQRRSSRSQSRSNVTSSLSSAAVTVIGIPPSASSASISSSSITVIPASPPQPLSPVEPLSPSALGLPDAAPYNHHSNSSNGHSQQLQSPVGSSIVTSPYGSSSSTTGCICDAAQTLIIVGLILEAIQLASLSFFPGNGPFVNTPAKYVSDAFGVFLLRMPSHDDTSFIIIWWIVLALTILSSLFAISIRTLPSHSLVNGILFLFSWLGSVFGVAFAATLSSIFLCTDRIDHGITIQVLVRSPSTQCWTDIHLVMFALSVGVLVAFVITWLWLLPITPSSLDVSGQFLVRGFSTAKFHRWTVAIRIACAVGVTIFHYDEQATDRDAFDGLGMLALGTFIILALNYQLKPCPDRVVDFIFTWAHTIALWFAICAIITHVLGRYGSYASWIPLVLYIGGISLLLLIALSWICFGGLHASTAHGYHHARLRVESDRSHGGGSGSSSRSSRTNSHRFASNQSYPSHMSLYGSNHSSGHGHGNGIAASSSLRQPLVTPIADL